MIIIKAQHFKLYGMPIKQNLPQQLNFTMAFFLILIIYKCIVLANVKYNCYTI